MGIICALVSRALLFLAALKIRVPWAVGIFLPFGPFFFRLNYPEEARRSWLFRLATLPCLFLYLILGPGPSYKQHLDRVTRISAQPGSYRMEQRKSLPTPRPSGHGPTVETTPSVEERRATNTREFERLRTWNETLRLKKRDLLHSDTDGNIAYTAELAQYTAALEKTKAERAVLWPAAH